MTIAADSSRETHGKRSGPYPRKAEVTILSKLQSAITPLAWGRWRLGRSMSDGELLTETSRSVVPSRDGGETAHFQRIMFRVPLGSRSWYEVSES